MHTFYIPHRQSSNANHMDHNARIQAAIADLESQERVNYAATAKKWNLDGTTLARRHRGNSLKSRRNFVRPPTAYRRTGKKRLFNISIS
jgi:hypothetical protein